MTDLLQTQSLSVNPQNNNTLCFENIEIGKVRVKGDSKNPLFCLSDVCKILEIQTPSNVKTAIEKEFDEGGGLNQYPLQTTGGVQNFIFITEPQLYFVLMRSRSEKAKPFRKWVTKEVLPSIRKLNVPIANKEKFLPHLQEQSLAAQQTFENTQVDTILKGDAVFFKMTDIEKVLGLSAGASRQWIKENWFDDDEIDRVKNSHGGAPSNFVAESGLYRILNRTNSPKAKPFERWVTKEVLPSIRKTGEYKANPQFKLPQTFAEALRELADSVEKVAMLENKITEQKPLVEFAENVTCSVNSISVGEFAKILGIQNFGQNNLFAWLRKKGYLLQNNTPYQKYIDNGYFEVKQGTFATAKGINTYQQTLITGKGQIYFSDKIFKDFLVN